MFVFLVLVKIIYIIFFVAVVYFRSVGVVHQLKRDDAVGVFMGTVEQVTWLYSITFGEHGRVVVLLRT